MASAAVTWHGVRLAEVLDRVGLRPDAVAVLATGLDPSYVCDAGIDRGPVRRPFPVEKALDDALLVWGVNGEDLAPDHGFPVRLVLPGWVGIANIKWLGSLEVSTTELASPWSTEWYRMSGGDHPADAPPLTTSPVRSAWELPWEADAAGRTAGAHRPFVERSRRRSPASTSASTAARPGSPPSSASAPPGPAGASPGRTHRPATTC